MAHVITWQYATQFGNDCQVEKFDNYVTAENRMTELDKNQKVAYVEWCGHDGKIIQVFDR